MLDLNTQEAAENVNREDLEGIHHGAQPNGADAARPEGDVEAVRAIQAVQTDGVA